MEMSKIKEMSDLELKNFLGELEKERYNLRIQAKTGQLEKSARIKAVKCDIARAKTEETRRAQAGK